MSEIHQDAVVHESSYVDDGVTIGARTKVWHFSHILPNCTVGEDCSLGQNVVVGPNVNIGNRVKYKTTSVFTRELLLKTAFFVALLACLLTSITLDQTLCAKTNTARQWSGEPFHWSNATIVCGNDLGEFCFIAAGAVVTAEVPAYALMIGTPARRVGWISRAGGRLGEDLVCPIDGTAYRLVADDKLEAICDG